MELNKQNVLLFSRSTQHGGTENVIVQICKILKSKVNKVVVCSANGFDTVILNNLGIKHYVIPDIENKSPKTILTVLKSVNHIIKEEKITVVHTHHRMAAFYTYILSNNRKIFFINTSHNTFLDKIFFTRLAYKKANLIACGEKVKKNLHEVYGIEEKKIIVIHNAIEAYNEIDDIDDKLQNWKNQGYILVGNIGRLSKQKGMEYFLLSLPKVLKVQPKVKYIIVGDGEDREKLKKLIVKLNIQSNVYFLGYKRNIRSVIKQLDFIVLSSLWEGLPLTPIEAFSVKRTVIGTEVDGTVEVIQNNHNGYLIPPKDPEAIAEKVCLLAENIDIRQKLQENAFETFNKKFKFEIFKDRIVKFYQKL